MSSAEMTILIILQGPSKQLNLPIPATKHLNQTISLQAPFIPPQSPQKSGSVKPPATNIPLPHLLKTHQATKTLKTLFSQRRPAAPAARHLLLLSPGGQEVSRKAHLSQEVIPCDQVLPAHASRCFAACRLKTLEHLPEERGLGSSS